MTINDNITVAAASAFTVYPTPVTGSSIDPADGSYQYANLGIATNFTAASAATNAFADIDIEGNGFDVTFMGMRYFTRPDGITRFRLGYEGGGTNLTSEAGHVQELAYAAYLQLDGNLASEFWVTNRMSGNLYLVSSNQIPGQTIAFTIIGETGGADRTITLTNADSWVIADMDPLGASPATALSLTVSNAYQMEISLEAKRQLGATVLHNASVVFPSE